MDPVVDETEGLTPVVPEEPKKATREYESGKTLRLMREAVTYGNSYQHEVDFDKGETPVPPNRELPPADTNTLVVEAFSEAVMGLDGTSSASVRHLQDLVSTGDTELLASQINLLNNLETIDKMNWEAIEESNADSDTLTAIAEGLDYFILRGSTIGLYEQIMREGETFGLEVFNNASNMSTTQFKEYYKGVVDENKTRGFFSVNNLFALEERAAQSTNRGDDPNATLMQVLGVAEVLLTAYPAFKLLKATKVKQLAHANPIQQAAKTSKGSSKAARASVNGTSAKQSGRALQAAGPSSLNPQGGRGAVNASRQARTLHFRQILDDLSSAFRRSITPDELSYIVAARVKEATKRTGFAIRDSGYTEVRPNVFASEVQVGKKNGDTFSNPGLAQVRANKIKEELPDAEVSVVQDPDTGGFYVSAKQNIRHSDVEKVGDVDVPESNSFVATVARAIGSSRLNDDTFLNSVAAFNEGVITDFAGKVERAFKAAVKPLSRTERKTTEAVLDDLWNGPNQSRKTWYDDTEFAREYQAKHPKNEAPSTKVLEAYHAMVDASDMGYMLTAIPKLANAVNRGFVKLKSAGFALKQAKARVFRGDLNTSDNLWDLKSSTFVKHADKKNHTVYRLGEPMTVGKRQVKYVTNPDEVKLLDLEDVMGYNAGPHRSNPNARYFITNGSQGIPRAFMTAFSRKQAERAKAELNNLVEARNSGRLAYGGGDEIVAANNSWNPEIETVADLNKYLKDNGLKLDKGFDYKQRDSQVQDADYVFHKDDTFGAAYNAKSTRGEVLDEYGGGVTTNVSPVEAIGNQLSKASYGFAFNGATNRSKVAYAKLVELRPSMFTDASKYDLRDVDTVFENVHVKPTETGPVANRMRRFRTAIASRTSMKSSFDIFLRRMGDEVKDFIFDTTGFKLKGDHSSVENQILRLNFYSNMGFLNVSQLLVQGFQAATIAAISPVHGFKAAGIASQVMLAADKVNDAAMFNMMVRRIAKAGLVPEDAIKASAKYIRTSGRDIADAANLEKGTYASFGLPDLGAKGALKTAKDAAGTAVESVAHVGLYPFIKGEVYSRRTAIITAHLEAKQHMLTKGHALFGKNFDDAVVQTWVTNREQALTFNMTNVGRGQAQQGIFKIPAQWTSYTFRVFENLALGRQFTAQERIRLGLILGPMMGLGYLPTWMGGQAAIEHLSKWLGAEPGDAVWNTLSWGIVDGALNYMGSDLSVSSRLSYPASVVDLANRFNESVPEALLGPTASITGGILGAGWDAAVHLASGRPTLATESVIESVRGIKTLDNLAIARGILKHGYFRSKTGTLYEWEMDLGDAAIHAAGFRTDRYNEVLEARGFLYYSDKEFREKSKEYGRLLDASRDLMKSDDQAEFERGIRLFRDISDALNLDPRLSEKQRISIRKGILKPQNNIMTDTIKRLWDMGAQDRARALSSKLHQGE